MPHRMPAVTADFNFEDILIYFNLRILISAPQKQVWSKRHKRMNKQEVNISAGKPEHHHRWYVFPIISSTCGTVGEGFLLNWRWLLSPFCLLNSNTKLKLTKEMLAKEWTFQASRRLALIPPIVFKARTSAPHETKARRTVSPEIDFKGPMSCPFLDFPS